MNLTRAFTESTNLSVLCLHSFSKQSSTFYLFSKLYLYKFLVMHRLMVLMPLTLLLVSSPVSTDRVLLESCKQMLKLLFRPCNRPSSLQRDPPIPPPSMSERQPRPVTPVDRHHRVQQYGVHSVRPQVREDDWGDDRSGRCETFANGSGRPHLGIPSVLQDSLESV